MPNLANTFFTLAFAALCRALLFERVNAPLGWQLSTTPLSPSYPLKLEFGLHQPRQQDLEARLDEISNPAHVDYGKHLSYQQLQHYTRPTNETVEAVSNWLDQHQHIESYDFTPSNSFVSVNLPVHEAERLLGAKFAVFKNSDGTEVVRTLETHLPDNIHAHIAVIAPTTYFGRFHAEASQVRVAQIVKTAGKLKQVAACPAGGCSAAVIAACDPNEITPDCLKAVYGINYKPQASRKQILGLTGYLGQYANYNDLKLFEQHYSSDTPNLNFSTVLVNKGKNSQTTSAAGIEANLDVQFAAALSYPIHNTFYSTGGSPPYLKDKNEPTNTNEPYLNFLNYLVAQKTLPTVLSTSYGDDEQSVPLSYANKVCSLYAQLGARGVTVLHASGDGGVTGGTTDGYCARNDGKNTPRFLPTFPASCPYVTSVGATSPSSSLGLARQVVAPYSSGGFSEVFETPSWQLSSVSTYLNTSKVETTYPNLFNAKGRGIPDVALLGTYYVVVQSGAAQQVYGTSAATPAFAAMIALLNDKRLAKKKATLGFINPWLYSTAKAAFTPVTQGSNPGCDTIGCKPSHCTYNGKPVTGFAATKSWSPAGGIGYPNFAKLLALA